MSKSKHYSSVEKKIFLEILKDLKHVVEVKKSDSSTLREKEVAWLEICKRYNNCTMISQEVNIKRLFYIVYIYLLCIYVEYKDRLEFHICFTFAYSVQFNN